MKLLALIPAHNEAQTIAVVVTGVKALGHDVLVINDGSTDATAQLAKAAGAEVVSTHAKGGKGNALRQGFTWALERGYEAVVCLDGDGQHEPADIQTFLDCQRISGAALVNGNRMLNPKGMPFVRRVTNRFMSWLISMICRQPIPDTQCGFRLISADVLKTVELECSDFEIETELLIKASKKGFKTASVPIATIYRNEVSKIKPIRDTLRFIRYIMKAMYGV